MSDILKVLLGTLGGAAPALLLVGGFSGGGMDYGMMGGGFLGVRLGLLFWVLLVALLGGIIVWEPTLRSGTLGKIRTGPFAARKTFVETLPNLMRRITPSPRSRRSPAVLSSNVVPSPQATFFGSCHLPDPLCQGLIRIGPRRLWTVR